MPFGIRGLELKRLRRGGERSMEDGNLEVPYGYGRPSQCGSSATNACHVILTSSYHVYFVLRVLMD